MSTITLPETTTAPPPAPDEVLNRYEVRRNGQPGEVIDAPSIWMAFAAAIEPVTDFGFAGGDGTTEHLLGYVDDDRIEIALVEACIYVPAGAPGASAERAR